jgi:Protein of unknown function (DUF3306)
MAEGKETFLTRWSRLKRSQPQAASAPAPAAAAPAPPLPAVEKLTPESDFTGFMHPRVKEELRRMALKKLFSDPHFKVPDPFEPYSSDWTVGEPIPDELLARLNQARTVLLTPEERKAIEEAEQAPNHEEPKDAAKEDEPGRQGA